MALECVRQVMEHPNYLGNFTVNTIYQAYCLNSMDVNKTVNFLNQKIVTPKIEKYVLNSYNRKLRRIVFLDIKEDIKSYIKNRNDDMTSLITTQVIFTKIKVLYFQSLLTHKQYHDALTFIIHLMQGEER